jgi:hypothetical protein
MESTDKKKSKIDEVFERDQSQMGKIDMKDFIKEANTEKKAQESNRERSGMGTMDRNMGTQFDKEDIEQKEKELKNKKEQDFIFNQEKNKKI